MRGDDKLSAYFDPDGPDMTNDVLMKLRFRSNRPFSSPDKIGNAIQSMRPLTEEDEALLERWARRLRVVSG